MSDFEERDGSGNLVWHERGERRKEADLKKRKEVEIHAMFLTLQSPWVILVRESREEGRDIPAAISLADL